ncbi:hypothetical protein Q1695_006024 [Nippostrongylus brasiliensis]|nr:hypothetical protein Q1695_006024 [Nippostrongylus brasiliensis]
MVHYKLSYFNNRGKAEIARQLFVLAGQEFEDKRYASREEYAPHASETPFGLLPVLEVDGKQLSQSNTIARYLARKFGYAGKTPFEEALVDSIADQYNDFFVEKFCRTS